MALKRANTEQPAGLSPESAETAKATREDPFALTADNPDGKIEELRNHMMTHIKRINNEMDKLNTANRFNKTKVDEIETALDKGLGEAKGYVDQEMAKAKTYIDDNTKTHADRALVDAKFDAIDTEYQNLKLTIKGDAVDVLERKFVEMERQFQDSINRLNEFGARVTVFGEESVRWSAEHAQRTTAQDEHVARRVEELCANQIMDARQVTDAQIETNRQTVEAQVEEIKKIVTATAAAASITASSAALVKADGSISPPPGVTAQADGSSGQAGATFASSMVALALRISQLERGNGGNGPDGGGQQPVSRQTVGSCHCPHVTGVMLQANNADRKILAVEQQIRDLHMRVQASGHGNASGGTASNQPTAAAAAVPTPPPPAPHVDPRRPFMANGSYNGPGGNGGGGPGGDGGGDQPPQHGGQQAGAGDRGERLVRWNTQLFDTKVALSEKIPLQWGRQRRCLA